MSHLPPVDDFLDGLSIDPYLALPSRLPFRSCSNVHGALPSNPSRVTIIPPSRHAALSLPPRYRVLSKWNSSTCQCLTLPIPQLSEMEEDGERNLIEKDVPYISPLLVKLKDQQEHEPSFIPEDFSSKRSAEFARVLHQKLKEAEKRIKQQHNLLIMIRQV